nr:hypothetical protein Iba_chr13dCG10900 [Ipomoea batatas]
MAVEPNPPPPSRPAMVQETPIIFQCFMSKLVIVALGTTIVTVGLIIALVYKDHEPGEKCIICVLALVLLSYSIVVYMCIFLAVKVGKEIKELSSTSEQIQRASQVEFQFLMDPGVLSSNIVGNDIPPTGISCPLCGGHLPTIKTARDVPIGDVPVGNDIPPTGIPCPLCGGRHPQQYEAIKTVVDVPVSVRQVVIQQIGHMLVVAKPEQPDPNAAFHGDFSKEEIVGQKRSLNPPKRSSHESNPDFSSSKYRSTIDPGIFPSWVAAFQAF